MKETVKSMLHFIARDLSMGVKIFNYSNKVPFNTNAEEKKIEFHFQNLKNRGFSFDANHFDEEGKFKGDNYGNYSLPLINLSDFILIKKESTKAVIDYLQETFTKIEVIDKEREVETFINTIIAALKFYLINPKYCYELDVNSLNGSNKMHPYYSLWEHFKSYLFFFNNNNPDEVIYMEIGFD